MCWFILSTKYVSALQCFKGGSVSGNLEEVYESNNQTNAEERRDFANNGFEFSGHSGRFPELGRT